MKNVNKKLKNALMTDISLMIIALVFGNINCQGIEFERRVVLNMGIIIITGISILISVLIHRTKR